MVFGMTAISSDATLNAFEDIGVIQFNPGDPLTFNVRVEQMERDLRYVPDAGATTSIEFLTSTTGTTEVVAGSFPFADDRSIVQFSLTGVQTANLIGQDLYMTIVEGANQHVAILKKGLQSASAGC